MADVIKKFLRYSANTALMKLGYEGVFPRGGSAVNPVILSAANTDEDRKFSPGSGLLCTAALYIHSAEWLYQRSIRKEGPWARPSTTRSPNSTATSTSILRSACRFSTGTT